MLGFAIDPDSSLGIRASISGPAGEARVLRLFSRLNVGGPSIHVILLAAGLKARGYATRLVVGHESPREGNLRDLAKEKGVDCVELAGLGREIRPLSDFWTCWALYRMIREFRPTIVHTHTAKAGVLGRVAARLARVPIIVHTYHGHVLRGYFGRLKTGLFRWLEARLSPQTDVLIAVSETVRQELVALGVAPESKIRVVPLGLELGPLVGTLPKGHLRKEAGVAPEAPLVGVVGRLVPIKDLHTLLQAAAIVRKSLASVHFAIVGDGEERDLLEKESAELGLAGFVHFHGWQRDLGAVYGDLDVVVNSSRNEGTPVALIEALAARRPVVATRVGGTPDLLDNGTYGTLVPPGDPTALGAAILETLRSPGPALERATAGQAYVLSHHCAERLINDIDGLYRELLARPAGAT